MSLARRADVRNRAYARRRPRSVAHNSPAKDVGTPVIATEVGVITDQKPDWLVQVVETGAGMMVDIDGLAQVLCDLAARAGSGALPEPVSLAERAEDYDRLIRAHQQLYASVIDEPAIDEDVTQAPAL